MKSKNLNAEERHIAMGSFDLALNQRAEPTSVFSALKEACLKRQGAMKSFGPLTGEELTWLRGVAEEGEAALAAMRSLIQSADPNARRIEGLKIRHRRIRRMIDRGEIK